MNTERLTPNPKCTRCKCYWKPDETDIKSSGLYCLTCKKCRGKKQDYKEQKKNGEQITCGEWQRRCIGCKNIIEYYYREPRCIQCKFEFCKNKKMI